MKLTVIINSSGKVAGTLRHEQLDEGLHMKLVPGPKQSAREIEVPDEFARLEPKELHARIVREYLKGAKRKTAGKPSKKR
jgi:hypothetical protein